MKSKKTNWLFFLAVVVLAGCNLGAKSNDGAGTSAKSADKKSKGPPIVGIINVAPTQLELTSEISGRISAFRVSEVRPQVTGIIRAKLFREGSRVNAGQVLYQIDQSAYRASYESALASVSQANANLSAAQSKYSRFSDLLKIGAVSEQEFEDARTAYRVASANLEVARAQLKSNSLNLKYSNLSAPISGRISKSNVTEGALVTLNQTQALATIVDISSVYVDFTQSYDQALKIRNDLRMGKLNAPTATRVDLKLPDGSIYERSGELLFTDMTIDPNTGSIGMRARFANPDGILLPGMYVNARISRGTLTNTIIIPQNAVSIDANGTARVFLLSADNKAVTQQVELGEMVGTNWQIKSGLKTNDKVITEGLIKVRPGMNVKLKDKEKQKTEGLK